MEDLMAFLTHLPQDLKAEELLDSIAQINISQRKYHHFQSAYNKERGLESDADLVDEASGAQGRKEKGRDCVIQ